MFERAGKKNKNNKRYQFWQQNNHPMVLDNNELMEQKLTYIHENPLKAGIVLSPFGEVMPGRSLISLLGQKHYYQGQYAEKDAETGYSAFELRAFDPVIGRWMAPDPYGQFHSPYLGMGNNPVSQVDPDGGYSGGPYGYDYMMEMNAQAQMDSYNGMQEAFAMQAAAEAKALSAAYEFANNYHVKEEAIDLAREQGASIIRPTVSEDGDIVYWFYKSDGITPL